MKTAVLALALLLGLAGATLAPSAPAQAQGWTTTHGGGAQGGGGG